MPNMPLLNATVKVTAKDINGNTVAKQFNSVTMLNFDYNDGTVQVIDATGSFYFGIKTFTTLTYTITTGLAGVHTVVMS